MSERAAPGRAVRPVSAPVGLPARSGVSFPRVLRAELGKAVTLPSTRWCVLVAVLVHAAVACVVAYDARYGSDAPALRGLLTLGLVATQLPVLVLGVLVSAAEYPGGAARSTFLAVPRRLPVLAAQTLVTAVLAALVAVAALVVTFLAVLPFRADVTMTLDATDPQTQRILGGLVLYVVAIALLGVALGTLARTPAAGLVAGVGLVFLLERLVLVVGAPWLVALLPAWAGRLVVATDAGAAAQAAEAGVVLTPWAGLGVAAAWVLVLLTAAAARLRHSDV
ncbi:hypothetical protein [Georgenia sp. Marseille-Q6866]